MLAHQYALPWPKQRLNLLKGTRQWWKWKAESRKWQEIPPHPGPLPEERENTNTYLTSLAQPHPDALPSEREN